MRLWIACIEQIYPIIPKGGGGLRTAASGNGVVWLHTLRYAIQRHPGSQDRVKAKMNNTWIWSKTTATTSKKLFGMEAGICLRNFSNKLANNFSALSRSVRRSSSISFLLLHFTPVLLCTRSTQCALRFAIQLERHGYSFVFGEFNRIIMIHLVLLLFVYYNVDFRIHAWGMRDSLEIPGRIDKIFAH